MKLLATLVLRLTPSGTVRSGGAVRWNAPSARTLLGRFRDFIETADWDERFLCHRWIDRICAGCLLISLLYFLPILGLILLK